jgi:hypothetical protein
MAGKLGYVINASSTPLRLTNTIAGTQQQGDSKPLPANSLTQTGGKDGNFIQIPDATPPYKFFTQDNTNLNGGSDNLYIYQTQGVVYWLVNSSPTINNNGNEFPNSANFNEGFVVVSQENGSWTMNLYDVNSI